MNDWYVDADRIACLWFFGRRTSGIIQRSAGKEPTEWADLGLSGDRHERTGFGTDADALFGKGGTGGKEEKIWLNPVQAGDQGRTTTIYVYDRRGYAHQEIDPGCGDGI